MNPSINNPDLAGAADSRQASGSQARGRRIDPIRSLRGHAPVAVLTLIAVLLAGFPIAWKKGKSTYMAQAVVYISPRFLKNLDDDKEFELQSNSQYREFVQQNVRTIDRYDIIEETLQRLSKQGHPWKRPQESMERAALRLQGEVKVVPVPDTYQITVRLEDKKPDGLAETVNTLVSVFLEKSKDEDFYGRDQRLASLEEEAQGLHTSINTLAEEKDKIAQELAVSVFSESFSNPFDQLLVGSKQALAAARQRRIISEAKLASLESRASPGAQTGLQAYADDLASKDADINSLQSNLNFRRNELLAKLSGMLPTHPARHEIEAELQQIDQVAQSRREDLQGSYAAMLLAQRRSEAAADARAESDIHKEVDQESAQAVWYSHNYQRGINIRYEMERDRKRLEALEDRMDFVKQEGRAPGFARLFSPARRPIEPMTGGKKKPLLILLVLAAAVALAVPIGLDYMDPRLLSPDEAEKILGFTPIGFTTLSSHGADANDHVQRIAAAIEREASRNGSCSFVFVPVNAVAPVSETVAALAGALAGLGHAVEVVGGKSEQLLARAATACPDSSDSGSLPVSAATSFGSVRNHARDIVARKGTVLISAKPFSVDPETELLVSDCDVVVLTMQSAQTTKNELQAILRTLDKIRPKAVAALVTGYDPNPPKPEVRLGLCYVREAWSRMKKQRMESEAGV